MQSKRPLPYAEGVFYLCFICIKFLPAVFSSEANTWKGVCLYWVRFSCVHRKRLLCVDLVCKTTLNLSDSFVRCLIFTLIIAGDLSLVNSFFKKSWKLLYIFIKNFQKGLKLRFFHILILFKSSLVLTKKPFRCKILIENMWGKTLWLMILKKKIFQCPTLSA